MIGIPYSVSISVVAYLLVIASNCYSGISPYFCVAFQYRHPVSIPWPAVLQRQKRIPPRVETIMMAAENTDSNCMLASTAVPDNAPSIFAFESLQSYVESSSKDSDRAFTCQLVPADTDDRTDSQIINYAGMDNATVTEINTIIFRPVLEQNNGASTTAKSDGRGVEKVYAVAIVPSSDKVDVRYFSEELLRLQQESDDGGSERTYYKEWELAPSHLVQELCGFQPGTIPPLLVPPRKDDDPARNKIKRRPFATIVDSSLWWRNTTSNSRTISNSGGHTSEKRLLLGGGGSIDHRCLIDLEFLVEDVLEVNCTMDAVQRSTRTARIASIVRFDGGMNQESTTTTTMTSAPELMESGCRFDEHQKKPFFQIAPPTNAIGSTVPEDSGRPHRPAPVTAIGRLTSVRQIAKRLVFADFAPPDYDYDRWLTNKHAPSSRSSQKNYDKTESGMPGPPWRSGEDGKDMYVQIIIGKTFCERYEDGIDRLKKLKPGKLVLVRGAANVDPMQKNGWRNSSGNWAQKRSLDVIVSSFEILEDDESDDSLRMLVEEAQKEVASRGRSTGNWNSLLPWERKFDFQRRAVGGAAVANSITTSEKSNNDRSMSQYSDDGSNVNSSNELTIARFNSHLQDNPLDIQIVDSNETAMAMAKDINELFSHIEADKQENKLLDYVAGIDCEWRPTGAYAEALLGGPDDNPVALLQICLPAIGKVYLVDTHRMLRANLDESDSMTEIEEILSEAIGTMFGSEQMIKVGYSVTIDFRRLAASFPHIPAFRIVRSVVELSTLAERLHPKSARPWLGSLQRLTKLVLGYEITKEEQCSDWEARPLTSSQIEYASLDCALPPRLLDEMAEGSGNAMMRSVLPGATKSWRFQTIDGSRKDAIRRLKAKRVVGNTFTVSQSWLNRSPEPDPTSIPEEGGGPYTDRDGLLKMPADLVRIGDDGTSWKTMSGKSVAGGKKKHCIDLLVGDAVPDDAILDYNPRSGFITFGDGLALFVNMQDPTRPSRRKMPYPNEWLEDGRILTWYIRKNDWESGNSDTAKLLLGSNGDSASSTPSSVVLFVRVGNGDFVCCGSCRASPADDGSSASNSNKKLVKLNLHLKDFETIKDETAFSQLIETNKSRETSNHENDHVSFQKLLAQAVVEGNVVGAFGMAFDALKVSPTERSIDYGMNCTKTKLSGSDDPLVLQAMAIVDDMMK